MGIWLAYLILHRTAPQFRYHLAYQFWPESSEAQARTNLRNLLHLLLKALPNAKMPWGNWHAYSKKWLAKFVSAKKN